ncbi:YlmH/Sll1252 family protein [Clostridium algidicarnis]|uniref:YlmH/Sll1252 family protein n=1 Tax=Clostridium algidicarnis TaxID=37659 RepID=UPI001C0DFC0D|nr:YlmH/Sll1252 family protein [Clostridium algidicarnis]MBU3208453.1 RNA-binding protein [Clostridium algidicarnis]MBU3226951.1 RNA-binding protein [Clostridium algidicarnis]MBU3250138.1 RNA-binding protein [Clostridium algidicarnis]
MNKKDFLNCMGEEDISLCSNIYDKILLSNKTLNTVYSNEFLTPNIWSKVQKYCNKNGIVSDVSGGFDNAERRIIRFNGSGSYYSIQIIKITNKSKFCELLHKDYLGALMSLGVKREKFGDLIVEDNKCYLPVTEDILQYIFINLKVIGKSPCTVELLNDNESIPGYNFKVNMHLASSKRIDVIISSITNLSRAKSQQYIKSGKVLIDYVTCYEKSEEVMSANTITIRGYGKYKVGEIIGTTSSGRLKIEIKKYI